MGVGEGDIVDGRLVARPSGNAEAMWKKYASGNISDTDASLVAKAVLPDGNITGLVIAAIPLIPLLSISAL